MKTNRVRRDTTSAAQQRQLKVPAGSALSLVDVELPSAMVRAVEHAARLEGCDREAFIRKAVAEKIEREKEPGRGILLEFGELRAELAAFLHLVNTSHEALLQQAGYADTQIGHGLAILIANLERRADEFGAALTNGQSLDRIIGKAAKALGMSKEEFVRGALQCGIEAIEGDARFRASKKGGGR